MYVCLCVGVCVLIFICCAGITDGIGSAISNGCRSCFQHLKDNAPICSTRFVERFQCKSMSTVDESQKVLPLRRPGRSGCHGRTAGNQTQNDRRTRNLC